ncbi:MAG: hypothetical protein HPY71_10690 [Firmicutes bacterium]|nr:hypothetical protein [Bacillota bacterium]
MRPARPRLRALRSVHCQDQPVPVLRCDELTLQGRVGIINLQAAGEVTRDGSQDRQSAF